MRIAFLDPFAGISGDMFLAALVGAGVPFAVLEEATAALGLDARLTLETVDRAGITAIKVNVLTREGHAADAPTPLVPEPHVHPHRQPTPGEPDLTPRSWREIRTLLTETPLKPAVRTFALKTFTLLARAEARIHNVDEDDIHFHEVGAVDAIIDIVAAAAGIDHLAADAWHCGPINVGSGWVRCAHGTFPVPAPATADLLRGVPTYAAHVEKELVTPTGAALLRALAPTFGPQPSLRIDTVAYGAGTRNPAGFPNVLRLSLGESAERNADETVTVIETALDDASPQLLAYVCEQALAAGALDVMQTAVVMKKGRLGTLLTVLCRPVDAPALERLLLAETTTLGLRTRQERRVVLDRSHQLVATEYGEIPVKLGSLRGEELNAQPEYEDCRRSALAHNVPLKAVQAAAAAAYRKGKNK